jgi:plastocyanin
MWSAAALVVLLSGATVLWGPSVQAADNPRVAMKDQLKYDPADISVTVNSAVVFYNAGSIQHDAKAEDGSFDTPLLDPGAEKSVTFTKPGDFKFYCSVEGHKSAGMTGVVHVTAAGSTPTTVATTTTTAPAGGTTPTTAGGTTTTTAKAAPSGASTTTTAPPANGATTTTLAPAATPTSAPEATATTAAGQAGGEQAADHNAEGGAHKKEKKKNSPIGIAFASVSTLLLAAIAGKLLASKS